MTNATIATPKGSRKVRVIEVRHGPVLTTTDDVSRVGRTVYTVRVAEGDFALAVQFKNRHEEHGFEDWLIEYFRGFTNPDRTDQGPMRVRVPSVHFDKTGVLRSTLPRQEETGRTRRVLVLSFTATGRGAAGSTFDLKLSPKVMRILYPAIEPLPERNMDKVPVSQVDYEARQRRANIERLARLQGPQSEFARML